MTLAFVLVALQTFRNRIWSRLRRLREPRYAAGFVMGLLYLWFSFFRRRAALVRHPIAFNAAFTDLRTDAVSLVLFVVMIAAWALPGDSGGLEFTEAEIAFLFPAPLARWQLLLYKTIRSQPQLIISVAAMTFFGFTGGKYLGLWFVFTTLAMYFQLVSLGRARLKLAGIGFVLRLLAVIVVLAVVSWLATRSLGGAHVIDALAAAPNNAARAAVIHGSFALPLLRVLLFVPRLFVLAAFPSSLVALLLSSLSLVALAAIFFGIAAKLNVSFEEASIAAARRKEERQAALLGQRAGSYVMFRRMRAPFRLRETGPAATAIVWKNVVAFLRISSAWAVLLLVTAFGAFAIGIFQEPIARGVSASMLLMLACFFPLMGTNVFTNDLRLDLPKIEILKSYPISGSGLIAGEIASPLAIIAFIEIVLLMLTSIMARMSGEDSPFHPLATPQFVTIVLLLVIPICALQLVIRNAVPVFLPAWSVRSKEDARGFVQLGQRLLILFGNVLVLMIALIPAALFFIPFFLLGYKFFLDSPLFVALATVPAVAVVALEVWLGIRVLGAQFEKLDASRELDLSAP